MVNGDGTVGGLLLLLILLNFVLVMPKPATAQSTNSGERLRRFRAQRPLTFQRNAASASVAVDKSVS